MKLFRVAFLGHDGTPRLAVLCGACLSELKERCDRDNVRCVVREFGAGDGMCELCQGEILREVGHPSGLY